MSRRRPRTWLDLFVSRVGIRRAGRVLAFVATYAATQDELGYAPSMEEYADNWGFSHATAYRDLRLFREAQPFFEQPAGLVALIGSNATAPVPADLLSELP